MSISKTTIKNTPVKLQNMRISVNQYIKKKLKYKKYSSKFEERVYNHSLKETDLNEIKKYQLIFFQHRYNNNLKFIISNIKSFEDKIKRGEITFNDIFNKNSIEIFPENWNEVRKRKLEEEKFLYETCLKSNCLEKCSKCKKQNVHSIGKQVRSADEPETHFYTCIECGHKWAY